MTIFEFPKNYSEYLSGLRKLIKNKNWKDNYRETVTVYGTAVRGQVCKCVNGGKRLLKAGDEVSFPKGKFEVVKGYWTVDKRILTFYDFSKMEFTNTDYRTSK